MENFIASLASTILGGITLTILFFTFKEKIFPPPNVSGFWTLTTTTTKSDYNPYKGLVIKYDSILWREGLLVKGSIEKKYERSQKGETEHQGKNRRRGYVEGYIEKNYLKNDSLVLHVTLNDFGRESTYFFKFYFKNPSLAQGVFHSMTAAQSGHAELAKDKTESTK
ncbi:hypothetical protein HNO51_16980 [Billgrantia sulfidoxydans]|uniref:Uncharacterized protein n=1 Tax=Billgrantia sulfidoxydans TaxID=2733484 RepID=A0ABX7W7Q7_9GAMM|nr:hypothetical protein [Halomonas sulfidoxydans]QTP56230.1 hypothetical protein HNO51_16980 [Halomonas sulfidoxydans]